MNIEDLAIRFKVPIKRIETVNDSFIQDLYQVYAEKGATTFDTDLIERTALVITYKYFKRYHLIK